MEDTDKNSTPQVLEVLQALKQASQELQHKHDNTSLAIKALLELHTESDTILSNDPNLSALSHHLSRLKHLVDHINSTTSRHRPHSLRSFLSRRLSTHSISKLANSIESEIQAWIDRESIHSLSRHLNDHLAPDHLIALLTQFRQRLSQGFNRDLQDLVLKNKIFSSLESVLFDAKCSLNVRENAGLAVAALIRFNKDVFVGQVLMGPTIRALVGMGSLRSIEALCSLIRSIKSPFVDEIESNGEIPNIIGLLDCEELEMRVLGMECVLEIGYFGRKEAVEAMLKEGLVEKLVELQRSELGGDLIDLDHEKKKEEEDENDCDEDGQVREGKRQKRFLEGHPFASCVARFAVMLEVGEGLRQREKRAFKQEILVRVREASVSDAEAATIVAEVLWGTSL
ncbi:hypothetical protein HN51_064060 [Arachis hypogaea]|uniref:Uncharacterized protein n=1 Tax=Arachis hypogaea TaxID=3818 RepID=A0A445AW11_ARAHY|nr:uncharacterized protein LOC107640491 [Arachis ipaensis]XP_025630439.1 uncharacterized protein LOC112723327 [Arachis hypogaea]QHO21658.1 uncharacterized protein DS421_11g348650 [Arachis hypogaea]RYR30566.1 hypothetical protein Ahy_B01g055310 [Arachis hypogaea]